MSVDSGPRVTWELLGGYLGVAWGLLGGCLNLTSLALYNQMLFFDDSVWSDHCGHVERECKGVVSGLALGNSPEPRIISVTHRNHHPPAADVFQ